jgi:hypothetical protein
MGYYFLFSYCIVIIFFVEQSEYKPFFNEKSQRKCCQRFQKTFIDVYLKKLHLKSIISNQEIRKLLNPLTAKGEYMRPVIKFSFNNDNFVYMVKSI